MNESELLARVAATLKSEVGPAVTEVQPKSQAFMAAVVLQKLSQQLAVQRQHHAAAAADLASLLSDLSHLLAAAETPAAVADAMATLAREKDTASLCAFITTLYAERQPLGEQRFTELLGRVRVTLRRDIDRRMEYAA